MKIILSIIMLKLFRSYRESKDKIMELYKLLNIYILKDLIYEGSNYKDISIYLE